MTSRIRILSAAVAIALAGGLAAATVSRAETPKPAFSYTADGKLNFPQDYRTWVYLSSGMDMAYVEGASPSEHLFDSVFVDPASYAVYQKTGTWPDKTIMVLEVRKGANRGSINKRGTFQTERLGAEVHVKDTARFKSGWAFFPSGAGPTAALPQTSQCNVCHEQHGAVDTTFVQFYPTLLPKAQEMKTLSAAYLAEEAAAKDEKR
jgi:cytochrome P460